MEIKFKMPGLGFLALGLSFMFSIVGFSMFFYTYSIDPYTINRWTVLMTSLSVWIILFLMINTFFKGNGPAWTAVLYIAVAFMLTYALLQLLQPCISPIAFVFASGDLNMGDVAKNKAIASGAIITAVFYVLAAGFAVAAAFLSADWKFGKKKIGDKQIDREKQVNDGAEVQGE